ncbi:MAG: FAD-binding dehydrogenase [Hydrocarboniphaga sp.]|uniref:FAD-dependent oxidoreductase n=1 Tax=Hydrocarboniphaga sp. TaxID=2033016 RepID=UPI0026097A62|nr:FAD-dependent oxidoreductase [Hydrocarboniphaga sp.]MDB5971392.1 FAD-binding dehydrogenase [Hydrocarboniphaga sp.]
MSSPPRAADDGVDVGLGFDVVVVGSGSAGMAAAIVAALSGLQVLLVEKTAVFGGATAWSGGGCWVPGNHLMQRAGIADSAEAAARYVRQVVGEALNETLLERFLRHSPEMLRYFEQHTQLRFELSGAMPDYQPELAGASKQGRLLVPVEFDGRQLGPRFAQLRPPLQEFNAPGGMMVGFRDADHLMNATRSWRSLRHTLRLAGRYLMDRLRGYSRGTRLTMGNALAGRLLRSALDARVTLWNHSAATALRRENGRVVGVQIDQRGRSRFVQARRGVVLASGGFSADPVMRAQHIPYADQHQSLVPEGNTGDGLKMAQAVGAVMNPCNPSNAAWNVISLHQRRDGSVQKFPHLFLDKPKPGCIAVNAQALRFGNEASLMFTEAMHASGSVPAWLICDGRFIRKYGLGLVYPGGYGLWRLVRDGYLIEAPTLAGLAQRLQMPADALTATVAEFNRHAAQGKDPRFGRGVSAFDLSMGDPAHRPNPSLGVLEQTPFYAVKIFPGDATTTLGLNVDGQGRALDADGRPIDGLYACGLDMNSLWAGRPPANGCNHSLNLTFGYLIARHLAGAPAE